MPGIQTDHWKTLGFFSAWVSRTDIKPLSRPTRATSGARFLISRAMALRSDATFTFQQQCDGRDGAMISCSRSAARSTTAPSAPELDIDLTGSLAQI
jgi:hypothetical protein